MPTVVVNLTDQEKEIFTTLLKVVREYCMGTVLRVAGGWVRDKLMGGKSDDIDITIEHCKVETFCEHLKEHLAPNEFRYQVSKPNPKNRNS